MSPNYFDRKEQAHSRFYRNFITWPAARFSELGDNVGPYLQYPTRVEVKIEYLLSEGAAMTIRAIIWDIGGVLARTIDRQPRFQLAARFGLTYEQLEGLIWGGERGHMAQRGEIPAGEQWRWAAAQLGLRESEGGALRQEFFSGDVMDEELLEYIRQLHRRYKTGIISNAMDDTRSLALGKWGFESVFDSLIFSAFAGVMKPDPHIYQLALQDLGVTPEAAVFIDDFIDNVRGAEAVGIRGIHFRSPDQVKTELEILLNAE
jgi:epoxide hydrolase-like predicted phosphatase